MKVRAARPDDAAPFASVVARVAEEGLIATEPPVDLVDRAAKARSMIESDGPSRLWVLEADDTIVGGLGLHSSYARGVLGLGMMILPEFRGRGGGRALVRAALDHAAGSEAHKVELEVWPDNARAIALYTSVGFVVEGVRRDHYVRRDGTRRSSLLMALLLAEPHA